MVDSAAFQNIMAEESKTEEVKQQVEEQNDMFSLDFLDQLGSNSKPTEPIRYEPTPVISQIRLSREEISTQN